MSEYAPEPDLDLSAGPADDAREAPAEAPAESGQELGQEFAERVRTGVEEVDAVLDSVDELEGRPVEEHVTTFESAHERLRGALDAAPDH